MKNVIIMGAAGRDFHNFNVLFRKNKDARVVCFTAEQIPNIEKRSYPKELAGKFYDEDIPIFPEKMLPELIKRYNVSEVVLSYSDLSYSDVMRKASIALSNGCDFRLVSPRSTMVRSKKPVIAICAVRTGCGKSPTTRKVSLALKKMGLRVVIVRHPMPYGNLSRQVVQRFESLGDIKKHGCTIEEMEEYEQHIRNGFIVYAGVDYEKILSAAEKEADIILWDGGNNDTPFFFPDLTIVVADALRAGHEVAYYPGEVNLRMADVVIINKENSARKENVKLVEENVKRVNPSATIIHANSIITTEEEESLKGKRVLVVEDGPTVTHGEMGYGAGYIFALRNGCRIIDPRRYAVGTIKMVFEKYSHLRNVLPAMGYGKEQIAELEETIRRAECDYVISGTPIELGRIINVGKRIINVRYDLREKNISLEEFLKKWCVERGIVK